MLFTGTSGGEGGRRFRDERPSVRLQSGGILGVLKGVGDRQGTAPKLVLNMLSTATMVRLGRVFSHWMIHVQMTNAKLQKRGREILAKATGATPATAARALEESGRNLPVALLMLRKGISKEDALQGLTAERNTARALRAAWADPTAERMKRRRRV